MSEWMNNVFSMLTLSSSWGQGWLYSSAKHRETGSQNNFLNTYTCPWLGAATKLKRKSLAGDNNKSGKENRMWLEFQRWRQRSIAVEVYTSWAPLSAQRVLSVNTRVTVASVLVHTSEKSSVSFSPSISAVGSLQPFDQVDFVRYMTELCYAKHPWGIWHLCTLKEKKKKKSESQLLPPALLIKRTVSQQERCCF